MLAGWRAEGIGREQLEVWVVGHDADAETVAEFAGDSEAACFVDSDGAIYAAFGAAQDDVALVDDQQIIRYGATLLDGPLTEAAGVEALDAAVRERL